VLQGGARPIAAVVGLGKRESADLETVRRAVGAVVKRAKALRAGRVGFVLSKAVVEAATAKLPAGVPKDLKAARAAFDAAYLCDYEFDRFQPKKREEAGKRPGAARVASFTLIPGADLGADAGRLAEAARVASLMEAGVRTARDLANLPANEGTPTILAERAREIAKETGLRCEVLEKADMQRLGMGSLLGVAQGSDQPPKLIVLEHNPAGAKNAGKPIALIGKGVTFDAGGISIKPADGMEEMRFDKSGACAVIGAMEAIARLGVPLHVVGLAPATENLLGGSAMKPGDVLRAMDGQTIEINNTDAEGRLILADAIAYAVEKYRPAAIVDLATLTGAVVVALGHSYAGLFSNDPALEGELRCASAGTGERIWPFPAHDDDYDERLKSWLADMKNSPGRPGGAVTASRFLRKFVKDTPWAHLDIAGTAWTTDELPYHGKGATGFGVRLLVDWLRAKAGGA
ncbi:MAG TPA: leucyl aminopeptidase, partial [Planctomycetota bacterium]|nr:leucyl aminopeptidase [Planctomycetota bacterium]